jgi:hypothetical protein
MGARGPKRDSHDATSRLALGDDLEAMKAELVVSHAARRRSVTERFLRPERARSHSSPASGRTLQEPTR